MLLTELKSYRKDEKMAYIWINPVVDRMYEREVLETFLHKHGYERFDVAADWLNVVKEKYRDVVHRTNDNDIVIDMRCPKTKELLDEMGIETGVLFPDIHPILIHCGQEGSQREDLRDDEKIITTPCQALADKGNALGLENTKFVSWRVFLDMLGEQPEGHLPEQSPIPIGFFSELGVRTDSVTGEEEIRAYFEKFRMRREQGAVQLVEILYCKDGCHNGDGICR